METITIPKEEYFALKREIKTLRNTKAYSELVTKLIESKRNMLNDGEYTRKDLGF